MKKIKVKTNVSERSDIHGRFIPVEHRFDLDITGQCKPEATERLRNAAVVLYHQARKSNATTEIGKHNVEACGERWVVLLKKNGSVWMESDGLHIWYAGAEKTIAGV